MIYDKVIRGIHNGASWSSFGRYLSFSFQGRPLPGSSPSCLGHARWIF